MIILRFVIFNLAILLGVAIGEGWPVLLGISIALVTLVAAFVVIYFEHIKPNL